MKHTRTLCDKRQSYIMLEYDVRVLQRVSQERNNLYAIKRRKTNWIAHVLRRNGLLQLVVEGKMEGRSNEKKRKKT